MVQPDRPHSLFNPWSISAPVRTHDVLYVPMGQKVGPIFSECILVTKMACCFLDKKLWEFTVSGSEPRPRPGIDPRAVTPQISFEAFE